MFRIDNTFLKVAQHGAREPLWELKDRLLWLEGRLSAPRVLYYGEDEEYEYLYSSRVPGIMACEVDPDSDEHVFAHDMPRLVGLLAQGLHMVHSVAMSDCPFDRRLGPRLATIRERVKQGLVSEKDYRALLALRPSGEEDLVFTHGDFCMPNIMIDQQRMQISGFIDLGMAGVADRYHDLALASWSLGYNFGPGWDGLLLQAYGISEPDWHKIQFYQRLDVLF